MQTILVTGASGFVGSRFLQRWKENYNILSPSHAELDITDMESIKRFFDVNTPHVILHLAAISDTWHCEQNPEASFKVNVIGTQNMAHVATMCGARFIFFSSDQVYNGNLQWGLLGEDLEVTPESVYAKHKLQAEQLAFDECAETVVLRATWMYDNNKTGLPLHNNFVENFRTMLAEHTPLMFPVREYRGITWVGEVVEFLPRTFSLPSGIYNYGAENKLNTYETACCFFEMSGCPLKCDDMIIPDVERYPKHERNISISSKKITDATNGDIFFSSTLDGLRIFLERNR